MITKHKKGFTLIEVMIIMLMVAVAMAVTAPIMTQRKSDSDDTPWKFAKDRSGDAYFAEYDDDITKVPSRVYLGHKDTCTSGQLCGRLMIEKNTDLRYPIIFKPKNGNKYALFHDSDKFLLGQESWYSKLGSKDVFLAPKLENSLSTGSQRTIVGYYGNSDRMNPEKISKCLWNKVGYPDTLGNGATGKGACEHVTGETAIDTSSAYKKIYDKFISGSGDTASVTAGHGATAPSGYYATAVGNNANAAGYGSVAVGYDASAAGNYSVAIGYGANAAAEKATAIGYMAENRANGGVSIGPMAGYGANDNILTAIGYMAGYNATPSHQYGYGVKQNFYNHDFVKTKDIEVECIGAEACKNMSSLPQYFTYRGNENLSLSNYPKHRMSIRPIISRVTVLGDEDTTVVVPGTLKYNTLYSFQNINAQPSNGWELIFANSNMAIADMSNDSVESKPRYHFAFNVNSNTRTGSLFFDPYVPVTANNSPVLRVFTTYQPNGCQSDVDYNIYEEVKSCFRQVPIVPDANWGIENLRLNCIFNDKFENSSPSPYGSLSIDVDDVAAFSTYCSFTDYTGISDKRLKNVSGLSTAGIDELNMLVPYNYTFKNDPKKTPQVGVIAQDLQNIFPDAVSEDENGFLTVRHEDMFYALVNAVKAFDIKLQELSFKSTLKRIVKLNKEIKELEDENAELKAKISDIYKRLEKAEKSL